VNIILGVSGSIAAVKSPEILRLMTKAGWNVSVVLTEHACQFATPLSFEALSGQKVFSGGGFDALESHLHLAKNAQAIVVAPATANFIAKAAHGIADDLLSSVFLAFRGPKLVVPAMHTEMFENPVVQENLKKLEKHGVQILGPDSGDLAYGDSGPGRMVSPELVFLKMQTIFRKPLALGGKKILVSAGGTREKIDSVRVISNLSTGKLGATLAHLASFFGAEVSLVSTVPVMANPHLAEVVLVSSAAEMKAALEKRMAGCDALLMAAAVSDFTPTAQSKKMKRSAAMSLELAPTPDILAALAQKKRKGQIFVGFCLEDEDLEKRAKEKLKKKNVDFIVANRPESIGKERRDLLIVSEKTVNNFKNASLVDAAGFILELLA
jgi:phosphopantothenoylcysteine decarboxylase/phosphopantothenate--cysteine ligase